jgi:DNA-binding FadR family transcriptional regulator
VMKSLRALAQASRIVTTTSEDSARQAIDDHKKILQAIKEHDGQGASYMMMAHLLGVEWKLREMLTERDKHSSSSE